MKKAFTLAEILISLVVIGIVAVIIIQVSLINVQNRVVSDQVKTSKMKFAKAMEMMLYADEVGPYYGNDSDTTLRFVDKLKTHLKINKICKKGNVADCFGYEEINLGDGEVFALNDIVSGYELQTVNDDYNDYSSDAVGIETIDGTHMILVYNAKCEAKSLDHTSWSASTESNAGTACVAALIDVDGNKAPNTLGKDVRTIYSARGVGTACPLEVNGTCYYMAQEPVAPVDYDTCFAEAATKYGLKSKYCSIFDGETPADNPVNNTNYWYTNVMTCGRYSNIASEDELKPMLEVMYKEDDIGCQASWSGATFPLYCSLGGVTYQPGTAARYGLPEPTESNPVYLTTKSLSSYSDRDNEGKKHYNYSLVLLYPDKVFMTGLDNEETRPNLYVICRKP